jgi:cytochrome c-type biogenesis protein CcmH
MSHRSSVSGLRSDDSVRRTVRLSIRALLVVFAFWAAAPAGAQDRVVPGKSSMVGTPETEAVAREAFFRLRSPVTPSHTLDMCPAPQAEALRDTMRVAAAEGQSVDQLVEGVIARYGEQMRILPERRGAGLWAWLMPPAALLLGAGALAFRLRRLRGQGGAAPAEGGESTLTDEERSRLDAALAELEAAEEEAV